MEPADKKQTKLSMSKELSVVFTQTQWDSSHLESLKPAQIGAQEDCRMKMSSEKERKVTEIERKEKDCLFFLKAVDRR